MITGQEQPIEPPKLRKRKWGMLLDIAEELVIESRGRITAPGEDTPLPPLQSSQVGRGVTFTPYGSGRMDVIEAEFCDDTSGGTLVESGDRPVFEAFSIRQAEACSALDIDLAWLNGRIDARWTVNISTAIMRELESGGHSGASPSLASSAEVPLGGSHDPLVALGLVEYSLTSYLGGAEGLIFVNPLLIPQIATALTLDGGQWKTLTGHTIVSDAGFEGIPPEGQGPEQGASWIYGSGPVGYKIGPPRLGDQTAPEYLDRTRNTITGRKVADAVIAFDPESVVAASAEALVVGS